MPTCTHIHTSPKLLLDSFGWVLCFSYLFKTVFRKSQKNKTKQNKTKQKTTHKPPSYCHVKKEKEFRTRLHLTCSILDDTIYKVIKASFCVSQVGLGNGACEVQWAKTEFVVMCYLH